MLQRIQTVYLFLGIVLNGLVFLSPLYGHAGKDPAVWINLAVAASLILASLGMLISIFLYTNRTRQIQGVKISILFQVIAIGFLGGILFSLGGFGIFLLEETLSMLLPIVTLILQYMAMRSIRKDDELVRSMDRIR